MTDEEFQKIILNQDAKLDAIYRSAERTRKYFMWTLIISVAFIVLPLIGLVFLIPQVIRSYSSALMF